MEILENIKERLHGQVKEANFEGANIVLYTDNEKFFKEGEGKIKSIVDEIKKRIELRADTKILMDKDETEKAIRKIIPEDAEIEDILFDIARSIVVIEAKKPGLVIGKGGSILDEIKNKTLWTPQVQRSAAIKSKITDNIREVLYANNNYRRKFLNSIGEKIYKGWNPEKMDLWVRLTVLGAGRQVGRSCFLLQTPNSKVLLDCGIDVASSGDDKFPYLNVPEFNINELDAIIVGFNVEIDEDVKEILGEIKVITDEVVYKLIENLVQFRDEKRREIEKKRLMGLSTICKLKLLPQYVFRNTNPAIFGVAIEAGKLISGLSVIDENEEKIGKIKNIQSEKKSVQESIEGMEVAISISGVNYERELKGKEFLYSDIGESHFRNFKKNKDLLSSNEIKILQEIAEIKRKKNPEWGA